VFENTARAILRNGFARIIAACTRYNGRDAEEWARLQSQTAFVVAEVNLRAEAAEAKVKELAAEVREYRAAIGNPDRNYVKEANDLLAAKDKRIAELEAEIRLLREAQPARCERHKCVVPSLNSICEICDHEEAVAYAVSRTKDKCADAAEAALQRAPDYESMHTMVRAAIMQVGNADISGGGRATKPL
jgi:chromosome segregation ATPase